MSKKVENFVDEIALYRVQCMMKVDEITTKSCKISKENACLYNCGYTKKEEIYAQIN